MVIDSVGPLSYLQRNLFSDVIVRTNLTRRTNPDFIIKVYMRRESKKIAAFLLVILVLLSACGKVPDEDNKVEADWRSQYGDVQTGNNDSAKLSQDIQTQNENQNEIQTEFRKFVPKEGQVELVLLMPDLSKYSLDEDVLGALNSLLQERGYSFYLSTQIVGVMSDSLNKWQEKLDAGESIDLLYFESEDVAASYEKYGNRSVIRAIEGEYLLPFSRYPETEAKQRLLAAYPDGYWKLCSFRGENYGVAGSVSDLIRNTEYVMLNLDAAEQAGIEVPEQLDLNNLDAMLKKAADVGIPGIMRPNEIGMCGIDVLPCGLYLKYEQSGEYRIMNPMEDEVVLSFWDAQHRYKSNGWDFSSPTAKGMFPLIICATGNQDNWQGDYFSKENKDGKVTARVKVYEEFPKYLMEGYIYGLMGITSGSEHKEEALELLSLMHTDEEVVKLLRYGIEGIHYCIGEDGKPKKTGAWLGQTISMGNRLMNLKFEEEFGRENKELEYAQVITEIEMIPYLEEFTEEQRKKLSEIRRITYITLGSSNGAVTSMMDKSSSIISVGEPDYLDEIEEKRIAFAEAGYNELAKEVNEAYGLE